MHTYTYKQHTHKLMWHFVKHQSVYGGLKIEHLDLVTHFLTGEGQGPPGQENLLQTGTERKSWDEERIGKGVGLIEGVKQCEQGSVGLQEIVLHFS